MVAWYVEKRRLRYYFRARIPADVALAIGRGYVVASLRTSDLGAAKISSAILFLSLAKLYVKIRATMAELSNLDATARSEQIKLGQQIFDLGADYGGERQALKAKYQFKLDRLIRELFDSKNVNPDQMLLIDENRIASIDEDLQIGFTSGPPQTGPLNRYDNRPEPVPTECAGLAGPVPSSNLWSNHRLEFFKDKLALSAKTIVSYDQAFTEWLRLIANKPLGTIQRTDVKAYANFLRDKRNVRGGGNLDRKTIAKSLGHIKTFMAWAVASGLAQDDGFHRVSARDASKAEKNKGTARDAFKTSELNKLFSSPVFSPKSSRRYVEADYWFLLLALFTGARTEELANAPASLVKLGQHWCLDLSVTGTKTLASPRMVPVLPDLVRLGILEWSQKQSRKGFTLVQPNEVQRTASEWSKQMNVYIDANVSEDPRLVLYSLRHNFRQMLRASIIQEELTNKIFGHAVKAVGAGYGKTLSENEASLFIQQVKSPISFEHLSASTWSQRK